MHHQLQQELRTALQRACRQDPADIDGAIQRLRSLDLQREIPKAEYDRLRCVGAARTGRFQDAQDLLDGLPSGAEAVLDLLARCPEGQRGDYKMFLARARRALRAESKRRGAAPRGAVVSGPGEAVRSPDTKPFLVGMSVIVGLVALAGTAAWLAWDRFGGAGSDQDESGTMGGVREALVATDFPQDQIGEVERHVARVVLELRVMVGNEFRWMPFASGTAFSVEKGRYLTNRHVVQFDSSSREGFSEVMSEMFGEDVAILGDQRITLVGSFGRGVLTEEPAEVIFLGPGPKDDVALLRVDDALGHPVRFAPVPPRRTPVYAVGFPSVSDELAGGIDRLEGADVAIGKFQRFLGEDQDEDGSIDLVRFLGPLSLEPTTTMGIVSKEEISDGVLQSDAVIARGNSGGPLLDAQGRIVGMNTWAIGEETSEGFSASLRSDRIRSILAGSAFHESIDWGEVADDPDN